MRPEQIMKMSMDNALIIRTGHSPVKEGQYIWYKEPDMKNLVFAPSNVPIQSIEIVGFDHEAKFKKKSTNGDDELL
jgi:type IV secretory pathway TraG/TraD family ATPase VirD4